MESIDLGTKDGLLASGKALIEGALKKEGRKSKAARAADSTLEPRYYYQVKVKPVDGGRTIFAFCDQDLCAKVAERLAKEKAAFVADVTYVLSGDALNVVGVS